MPPGKLVQSQNGAYRKWYMSDGKSKTYLPKKSRTLIQQLAYKKYLELEIESLTIEKNKLTTNFKANERVQTKLERLLTDPEYIRLLNPIISGIKSHEDWMNAPYQKSTRYPEQLIHETVDGLFVRSKAESMIAFMLKKNDIPFRYECLTPLNGIDYYPDFTLINPSTGNKLYWEHFGKMDDTGYIKDFQSKVPWLAQNGIIIGKNLIPSFETSTKPLTFPEIQRIIDLYLLS